MNIVSTQCSDSTSVFIMRNADLEYSNVYLIKDGALIFSEEKNEEIHHAREMLCLKHGIIIFAEHGAYYKTMAILSTQAGILLKELGTAREPGKVTVSQAATHVAVLDSDGGLGPITEWKEIVLKDVFRVPNVKSSPSLSFQPVCSPHVPVPQAKLTALMWCFTDASVNSYIAEAYTDEKGAPYLACYKEYEDKDYPPVPLPFAVTGGICRGGNAYLFGNPGSSPEAVELLFDKTKQEFYVEPRNPKEIPLRPYLP